MKHFVNLLLLLFFSTLVSSGLLRFFKPFDLVTTRVHILFGFGVLLLVGLHLASRGKYFLGLVRKRGSSQEGLKHPVYLMLAVSIIWGYCLVAALSNWWPADALIGASYESQHVREIFRDNSRTAFESIQNGLHVKRVTDNSASIRFELEWGEAFTPRPGRGQPIGGRYPQIAIWAEAEDGTVLETLFVSQACAASQELDWGGHPQSRSDILPIWYSRYKDILGAEPNLEFDAVSSATPMRDFSMEGYLRMEAQPFTVYVEVNAPNDENNYYHHNQSETGDGYMREGLGQPSVLYEAFVFSDNQRRYFLLELIAHSGSSSSEYDGLHYELDQLSSARHIVEKILLKVVWPN